MLHRALSGVLFCALPLAALVTGPAAVAAGDVAIPDTWRTVSEKTDFRATSTYDETMALLERIAEASPHIALSTFGRSAAGRPLPLVVVSTDGAFTPDAARRLGKPVVMVQNAIHAGEIDGKDASLMILRDLARGAKPDWLERLTLVLLPIYNADGHERISPYHRPNQDGPVDGMGFRTTDDGHDLNRDHLKLDTPEGRAVIELFNRWRPHLHVDNHVTNGSDHAWVLTYSWAEAPQLAAPLDAWLRAQMPGVLAATETAGHRIGPYVSLIDNLDPSAGFNTVVGEPRYATGYYPLRHCPSILVETHAHKPFRDRVLATRDFVLAILDAAGSSGDALRQAVTDAGRDTRKLGAPDAEPSSLTVRYEPRVDDETVRFPAYDWYVEDSTVTGGKLLRFRRGELREIDVPWIHRVQPSLTVARPRGYLLLPGWPEVEVRLASHGLVVRRLTEATTLEVETLRASELRPAARSYQGRVRVEAEIVRAPERVTFPEGSLWIPADQPDFEVAAQLLEPEAPDSLFAWGFLSIAAERKEYIGLARLEDLAREMLAGDAALAREWSAALEDGEFAADRGARWLWWYRRTPYWDATVGRLPYMRAMTPPDLATEPWPMLDNGPATGEQ